MNGTTPQEFSSNKGADKPAIRRSLVRRRMIGASVAAVILVPQVVPQVSALSISPAGAAWSAKLAVEKAAVNTLTVRSSLNAANVAAQSSRLKMLALRKQVVHTWMVLQTAPVRSRPALQKTLTYQTGLWQASVQLYTQRNATYLYFTRLNAATEADFRAKSANALVTARAVPVIPACAAPANPYAGAGAYRVMTSPGVSITRYAKPGRNPLWVTTANLKAPGAAATVGPLTGRYVASRTQLAQQIAGTGALVGVNADFYDFWGDKSPWGATIKRGGAIINSRTDFRFKGFRVQGNGLARFGYEDVRPVLHHGTSLVSANSLNTHYLPVDGIAVFTPQWGPASRGELRPTQSVLEYVVTRGVITAIRARLSSVAIPQGGLVIVAQGSAIRRLTAAGFRIGARVYQTSSATSLDGGTIYSSTGVGLELLQDGQYFHLKCTPDKMVARTAIGIRPGGREIVLVTVRGQTDGAVAKPSGMSVRDMAAFMRYLGVYNAAMFDGGGSTILIAKIGGSYRQLNAGQGFVRPVSNSFGIWPG